MTESTAEPLEPAKTESTTLSAPVSAHGVSEPIAPNRGWLSQIWDLDKHIFGDFYNDFRLIGYIAEIFHGDIKDKLKDKKIFGIELKEQEDFKTKLFTPDIINSKPRFIVNTLEASIFEAASIRAFFRDRKQFRHDIGQVIAAETGQEKDHLSMRDAIRSDNPLIQSATNRSKALYTLRFLQPLAFLFGFKLGVTSTVFEIVAERAAYFEKNSYDRMQKLCKDIKSNQYGAWSRDSIVEQMIDIIQQNRLEHHSTPIDTADIMHYMPLLHNLTDRMVNKEWGIAEAVFVLGQIVKEPAALSKAEKSYNDVATYSLKGITQMKMSGRQSLTSTVATPEAENEPKPAFVKDIIERGPKNPALAPATPAPNSFQIAG